MWWFNKRTYLCREGMVVCGQRFDEITVAALAFAEIAYLLRTNHVIAIIWEAELNDWLQSPLSHQEETVDVGAQASKSKTSKRRTQVANKQSLNRAWTCSHRTHLILGSSLFVKLVARWLAELVGSLIKFWSGCWFPFPQVWELLSSALSRFGWWWRQTSRW